VAQLVENLLAMWGTWVQSLGWEDLLEKGKATHSSILAWRIPWTIQSMGFSRQEYWSGLPFPSPGDLLYPRAEPMSVALASMFFTSEPPGTHYV